MATPAFGNTSPGMRPPTRAAGREGTEEFHSATLPAAQEAAVLYSADFPAAAVALLKNELKDPQGRNNKQAWLMLFDLYQCTGNRAEYDALSMLFTVKFEQSPPAFSEGGGEASDPRRAQARERKDFFPMKPAADGGLAAEIERFVAFAEAQGTVRLDVAKVTAITAEEAGLLAAALMKLRKRQLPMWFNNLEALEKVLRGCFNDGAPESQRPCWHLLFELMVLQGKMGEHEELGLEYAVAFEESPPVWENYVNTVAQAAARTAAPAASAPPAPEAGFPMKGVLSAASASQVADLNGYAASRSEVVIDMGKVLRVDFAYTSALFDAIKAIQLAGKRVIITSLNELNAALLEALGVNRYAILVRRKST
jgi:anti-anti-sigma regulatory factor